MKCALNIKEHILLKHIFLKNIHVMSKYCMYCLTYITGKRSFVSQLSHHSNFQARKRLDLK